MGYGNKSQIMFEQIINSREQSISVCHYITQNRFNRDFKIQNFVLDKNNLKQTHTKFLKIENQDNFYAWVESEVGQNFIKDLTMIFKPVQKNKFNEN